MALVPFYFLSHQILTQIWRVRHARRQATGIVNHLLWQAVVRRYGGVLVIGYPTALRDQRCHAPINMNESVLKQVHLGFRVVVTERSRTCLRLESLGPNSTCGTLSAGGMLQTLLGTTRGNDERVGLGKRVRTLRHNRAGGSPDWAGSESALGEGCASAEPTKAALTRAKARYTLDSGRQGGYLKAGLPMSVSGR